MYYARPDRYDDARRDDVPHTMRHDTDVRSSYDREDTSGDEHERELRQRGRDGEPARSAGSDS
jgi:hypothetical protein